MFIGQEDSNNLEFGRGKDRKKRKRRGTGFSSPAKKKTGLARKAVGVATLGTAGIMALKNRKGIGNIAKAGAQKVKSGARTLNNASKIYRAQQNQKPFQNKSQAKSVNNLQAQKRSNQAAKLERDMYASGASSSQMKAAKKAKNQKAKNKKAALKQRRNLYNVR